MAKSIKASQAASKVSAKVSSKVSPKAAPVEAKPVPVAPKAKGPFGERPESLKGKMLALLTAKPGKPVKVSDAVLALYGKEGKGPGAIAGVIWGAEHALLKAGKTLVREGKGAEATLTVK